MGYMVELGKMIHIEGAEAWIQSLDVMPYPTDEQRKFSALIVAIAKVLRFIIRVYRRAGHVGDRRTVINDFVHEVQCGAGPRVPVSSGAVNGIFRRRRSAEAVWVAHPGDGGMDVQDFPEFPAAVLDHVCDTCHVVIGYEDVGILLVHEFEDAPLEGLFAACAAFRVLQGEHSEIRGDPMRHIRTGDQFAVPVAQIPGMDPASAPTGVWRIVAVAHIPLQIVGDHPCKPENAVQLSVFPRFPGHPFHDPFHVSPSFRGVYLGAVLIAGSHVAYGREHHDVHRAVILRWSMRDTGISEILDTIVERAVIHHDWMGKRWTEQRAVFFRRTVA